MRELGAFARPQVLLTVGFAAVGFGGVFAVFSYIALTTTHVTGLPASVVPLILAIFGAGMVAGNVVGAWLADRSLMRTIGGLLVFNVVVLATFALTAAHAPLLCLDVLLLGSSVALAPAVQTRLMDVAVDAQTMAAASMHSAFNLANGAGAWLGGLGIAAGRGYASTGWVGAGLGSRASGSLAGPLGWSGRDEGACRAPRDRRAHSAMLNVRSWATWQWQLSTPLRKAARYRSRPISDLQHVRLLAI